MAKPQLEKATIMRIDHRESDLENHDRGLDYDLPRLLQRRGMLKLVAGAGLAGSDLMFLATCGRTWSSTASGHTSRMRSRCSWARPVRSSNESVRRRASSSDSAT